MQLKSGLSMEKLQYRWVRALNYDPISPSSHWLAEWFPLVLLEAIQPISDWVD